MRATMVAPAGQARPLMRRLSPVAVAPKAAAATRPAFAAARAAARFVRAATPTPTPPTPTPVAAPRSLAAAPAVRSPRPSRPPLPRRPLAAAAAAASNGGSLNINTNNNPLARALGRELGVQSASLDPRLRESVEAAIERSPNMRLTVGDAAASAGVSLAEADACLRALAYDCLAALEVSASGDVAYCFPRDFRAALVRKSVRVRAVPLLRRAEEVGAFLVRAAFGAALVASAAIVWSAVFVLSSSQQRDDRRGGGGFGGGGGRGGGGLYLWVDPLDWLLFWDPRYARRQRARADRGDRLSFLEAVFSFVFGDGDPNEGFPRRRWRALAAHVRRLGGVVAAEELAPFLDPPRLPRDARTGRILGDDLILSSDFGGVDRTRRRARPARPRRPHTPHRAAAHGVAYRTAWYLCHCIRKALYMPHALMMGVVEVDETYIGGKVKGRSRPYTGNNTAVVGAVERKGKAALETIDRTTSVKLRDFIRRHIVAEAIFTDGYRAYGNLSTAKRRHETVNHSEEEWVRGDVHTNSIENAWSLLSVASSGRIIGSARSISTFTLTSSISGSTTAIIPSSSAMRNARASVGRQGRIYGISCVESAQPVFLPFSRLPGTD